LLLALVIGLGSARLLLLLFAAAALVVVAGTNSALVVILHHCWWLVVPTVAQPIKNLQISLSLNLYSAEIYNMGEWLRATRTRRRAGPTFTRFRDSCGAGMPAIIAVVGNTHLLEAKATATTMMMMMMLMVMLM
jgi:hypothetical protein